MKEITREEALDIAWETLEKAEKERSQVNEEEAKTGIRFLEQIWIVGQAYTDYHPQAWEFVGVFSTKEKAIEVCKTERHFIAPIYIDAIAPDEMTMMPNCFFPKGEGFPE